MRWTFKQIGDRYAIIHGHVIRAFTCPCASQETERVFAEAVVAAMNATEPKPTTSVMRTKEQIIESVFGQ